MITLARVFLAVLSLLALVPSYSLAQEPTFSHPVVTRDAEAYEAFLKAAAARPARPGAEVDTRTAGEARAAGLKQLIDGDAKAALKSLAHAVTQETDAAATWLALARAHLAVENEPDNQGRRHEHESRASGAAFLALKRSSVARDRAEALAVLSDALGRRSMWRPALEALRQSLALNDDPARRKLFEELKAEHGFRVTDYAVDNNAAEPRLCVVFSEPIVAPADIAKFVSVDGRDPQGVTAESDQICIEGLGHGKRYAITVRPGVGAVSGEKLLKAANLAVYVRDRARAVRFPGRAYVLPNRGQQGIPVVSVNVDRVAIEILRVGDRGLAPTLQGGDFQRQISSSQIESLRERTGARVWKGELEVKSRLNEDVTTAIPVAEAIPKLEPGVYIVLADPVGARADTDGNRATQWLIVSDLGLTALTGDDGINAFVRSLATAAPSAGVNVRLVARNNEVLATGKTDSRGHVRFDAALKRGEGGQAPAVLIAEAVSGDYAFLDLEAAAFDLSDRGVGGRAAPGPIDGFLYSDRGIYRAGETVHLSAIVRDKAANAALLPTTLIITRPDGVELRRYALPDQGLGGRAQSVILAATAMSGTWRARLHVDPRAAAIAELTFLVEDFVPERIDVKLEPVEPALKPGTPGRLKITGRYLYGPPAAGLALEGDVVVKASTADLPGLAGFRFGIANERINPVRRALDGLPETGADGTALATIALPAIQRTARPLEADVIVRMRESGGRTVERKVTLPIHLGEPRVGIRPLFKGASLDEGETASFETLVIDAENRILQGQSLGWRIVRLNLSWQWFNRNGQWAFEPVTTTRRVGSGSVKAGADGRARIDAKLEPGRYRLEVTGESTPGPVSSMTFGVGYHDGEQPDSPEVLDVALDKAAYKAGDTARVRINSRQAGKLQLTVVSGRLLAFHQADIPAGGGEVSLQVAEDWLPGVYVLATLFRPMDEAQRRMPGRAVGIRWLPIDTAPRTLAIDIQAPEKAKPRQMLRVPVVIAGLAPGEEARLTLAAVDAGVLGVTRFEPPAPARHFYGQRRLGAELRDLYGRLIDGMRAERGRLRSGGDGGAGGANANPPVEKPLALFSGLVRVGADGRAFVDLDLPDFNGTLRLMAVAWTGSKLGNAAKDMIVRDGVALTVSGPRFLTLGDEARLELALHNVEAPAGEFRLTVGEEQEGLPGAVIADKKLTLGADQRRPERLTLRPKDIGPRVYEVRLTGPGGVDVRRRLAYTVMPPAGDIRRMTIFQLKPKDGRLVVSRDLLTDLIPSSARVMLNVGPSAGLDVPGLLGSLESYPYACAEQTISRTLPLLYSADIARQYGLGRGKDLKEQVAAAIERVLETQDSSGAFGIWAPGNGDMWLTAYAVDFMTRAKEKGHEVPLVPLSMALDRLANFVANAADFKSGGEAHAYALYVLARNARAPVGELRYWIDTRLERFATPLSQAHLGAAAAMMADRERAERALKSAIAKVEPAPSATQSELSRADYGSRLRDGAAIVTLIAETRALQAEAPRLMSLVSKAYARRQYTSTQEQAWLLLASRALAEEAKSMSLTVGTAPHRGPLMKSLLPHELASAPLVVANTGEAPVDAAVTVMGSAMTAEPAAAKGLTVERSYFTLEGREVVLASATGGVANVSQNDRFVVVLTVKADVKGGRILLVDRLPAGLEIENARIVDGGDVRTLAWLKRTIEPEHRELRDDRFVASFNLFGAGSAESVTIAYVLRAVTPGSFIHPAATVEDMYQPERYARTGSGRLTVLPKE